MAADPAMLAITLTALGFVLNVIVLMVGGVWKLSRVENAIKEDISNHQQYTDSEFAKVRREFGETAAAIRQKLHEIELWSRDHFVLREAFQAALGQVTEAIQTMDEKIETRLMRMETKIERPGHHREG
jgi:hypothetical protein